MLNYVTLQNYEIKYCILQCSNAFLIVGNYNGKIATPWIK